jgi:hypothetical protein
VVGRPGLAGGLLVAVEDGLQGGRIEDAVGPGVELVQRGGLEARGDLLVEWAEALGQLPGQHGDFAFDSTFDPALHSALHSAFNLPLLLPLFSPLFDGFSQHGFVLQQGSEVG